MCKYNWTKKWEVGSLNYQRLIFLETVEFRVLAAIIHRKSVSLNAFIAEAQANYS
jgi:hypothetical protein